MKIFTDSAILRAEGLSGSSMRAVCAKLADVERSLRHFDAHVDAALHHPRLSSRSKRFLKAQWYGEPAGALSLGNRAVQRAKTIASIVVVMSHAQECPPARRFQRRFRMLTTAPDLGLSDFVATSLKLSAIRRHFYISAKKAQVDALGFLDIAVIDQKLTLEPLRIGAHMHGAIRAIDKSFRTKRAEQLASPVGSPLNACGLRVIRINAKKKDWGPPLTKRNVARLGYYSAKMTCGIDAVFTKWQRRQNKTTLHGWTIVHALRQLECYSHCDALETTCGVGKLGSVLRSRWKTLTLKLLKFDGAARSCRIDHDALRRDWQRIWNELGEEGMTAVRMI